MNSSSATARPDAASADFGEAVAYMTRHEADMAFRKRVQTAFEWLAPRDGMTILDVPCGRGFYLKMLRHVTRCRLVGIELDPAVLAIARRHVGHLPDVHLYRASVTALPLASSSVEAVLLSEVLEHVADDVAAVREAARVMKPGAVAVITVPHERYPFWWDPINRTLETLAGTHISRGPLAGIWANHLRLYSREHLRAVVEAGGLIVEQERSFTHACFPFIHNLVYGLGKPLLESGVLGRMGDAADRTAFDRDPGRWNPVALGIRLLAWFDRHNRLDEPPGVTTVNLAVKARKPAG